MRLVKISRSEKTAQRGRRTWAITKNAGREADPSMMRQFKPVIGRLVGSGTLKKASDETVPSMILRRGRMRQRRQ
jgi:hypothetical protein